MKRIISIIISAAILITATASVSATHIGGPIAAEVGDAFVSAAVLAEFRTLSSAQKNAVDTILDLMKVVLAVGTVEDGDSGGPIFTAPDATTSGQFCGVLSGREMNAAGTAPTGTIYMTPYGLLLNAGFVVNTGIYQAEEIPS